MLESNGLPLYLTNENYPNSTTTISTCSCSVQANSCSSDITRSILDLDLYHKQDSCEQFIDLTNGTDDSLEKLDCVDFYNNGFTVKELRTHYLKITFINNSTQNLEGLFFIGFAGKVLRKVSNLIFFRTLSWKILLIISDTFKMHFSIVILVICIRFKYNVTWFRTLDFEIYFDIWINNLSWRTVNMVLLKESSINNSITTSQCRIIVQEL